MTRDEAEKIRAAHLSGAAVSDVDLMAAVGVLEKPVRKKRLPKLAQQKQIDDSLGARLAGACRKVA